MTFNIRIDVAVDGKNKFTNRLEEIIEFIQEEKPDIIGFQEVNQFMLTSLSDNLIKYNYVGEPRDEDGEYNPIFYLQKHSKIKSRTYWLSDTPNLPGSKHPDAYFPRIYTTLTIDIDNQLYEIVNTHLSHVSDVARIDGMKAIIEYYKETSIKNFILMGDFNAHPDQGVNEIITEDLKSCWDNYQEDTLTFHNFSDQTVGLPIDYIFSSKNINILKTTIHRNKINNKFLSDHYPISETVCIKSV